jgi:hypothetical protein
MTRTQTSTTGSPWLWIGLLAVASVALSFKLSCATPFAALATLAALHMSKRDGVAMIVLAFALNQAVGYCALDYPRTFDSFAWGAAIGVAALATFFAASELAPRLARLGRLPMMAVTLVAAFAVYEIVLFAATAVLPATEVAFSWPIVGEIGLVNALVFPALLLAHQGAELMGLTPAKVRV